MKLNFSVIPNQNGEIDQNLIDNLGDFYSEAVYNYYQNLIVSLDIYENFGNQELKTIIESKKQSTEIASPQNIAEKLFIDRISDEELKKLLLDAIKKYSIEATKNIGARIGKEATESEFSRGVDKLIVAKDPATNELVGFFMFRVCNQISSLESTDDSEMKKFVYIGQACVRKDLQKSGVIFKIAHALTNHLLDDEKLSDQTKITYITRNFNTIAPQSISRAIDTEIDLQQTDKSSPIDKDTIFPVEHFGYKQDQYSQGLTLNLGRVNALLKSKISREALQEDLSGSIAPGPLSRLGDGLIKRGRE